MSCNDFITKINEKYSLFDYADDEEIMRFLFNDHTDVFIEINEVENTFDIFYEFVHPLYDYEEFEHHGEVVIYESSYLKSILTQSFYAPPEISEFNYIGAPFDDERIGYFGIDIGANLEFIDMFLSACEKWESTLEGVETEGLTAKQIYFNFLETKWKTFKNSMISRGYILQDNMVKRHDNSIVFSFINDGIVINKQDNVLTEIINTHIGVNYFLFEIDGSFYGVDKLFYDEVVSNLLIVDSCSNIQLFSDKSTYLHFKTEAICGFIKLSENIDYARYSEYNYLEKAMGTFHKFIPPEKINKIKLNHLGAEQFEKLTMEFLTKERFYDIHPVGKINAYDGGKDLLARKKDYHLLSEDSNQLWIIQCKFTEKSKKQYFSRSMFTEIPYLLKLNYAHKYLLITSGYLSSASIEMIQCVNRENNDIITFYQADEFKLALIKYPDLITKYKLIEGGETA